MPSDKRERQRLNRAAADAQRDAALRRRRTIRLASTFVVVGFLVAVVLTLSPGGASDSANKGNKPTPAPTDSLVPAKTAELPSGCHDAPPPNEGPATLPSPAPHKYAQPSRTYHAVVHTNCGDITVTLDAKAAPTNVNNFIYLADKGYYNGLYWHRIVRNFVIQAGDPNGKTGVPPDGPGYTIPDEFPSKASVYTFGTVAMANSGQPDSAGGQFFVITHEAKFGKHPFDEPAGLAPRYSVLGHVSRSSFPVLERIQKTPVVGGTGPDQSEPVAPVFIEGMDVSGP